MPDKPPGTSRGGVALVIGLAAAGVVAACHGLHLDRRAELLGLDFRFRHFSSAPQSQELTIVKIDDRSLEQYGRWPWPRQMLAGLIDVLAECGAREIALDIILPEPQPTRNISVADDLYDADASAVIGSGGPQPVFDDNLLAEAIARHRVILAMHVEFHQQPETEDDGIQAAVDKALRLDPQADFAAILQQVGPALRQAQGGLSLSKAGAAGGARTPQVEAAARAYWRCRARHSLRRFAVPAERVAGYPAPAGELVPPFLRFASACGRSGFVSFPRDIDGVVRHIPLLARSGDEVYPQFALALAAEWLADPDGGSTARLSSPKSELAEVRADYAADAAAVRMVVRPGRQRSIPVDRLGNLMINWAAGGGFDEIPAGSVLQVWQQRQRRQKNLRHARLLVLDLAQRLKQMDLLRLFAESDALHSKRLEYEFASQRAALYEPGKLPALPAPPADLAGGPQSRPIGLGGTAAEAAIEAKMDAQAADLLENLDFYLQGLGPDDPQRAAATRTVRGLADLAAGNKEIEQDIERQLGALRQRVAGRICLVGSTATGAADFVPTPVEAQTPGVVVHANILNTILSGSFVTEAPAAVNLIAILLAGAVVSLLTARLPVIAAGVCSALAAAGYVAVGSALVFARWHVWIVLVAPVAAMAAGFLAVTAYRQLTEERARRHIRNLFAHALSPALVDRLIEDPSLARLGGERRVLSCFLSDLAGFTPLSEMLGEQGTVRVINRYFDRMTDVIQETCGGYLNKFLGDGIIALFGAPVMQPDHARRAVQAAVLCQEELGRLNEELAGEFGSAVRLSCRIGIATGPVMVGNCGSTKRMDYTAIGDTVNLASRLESAGKFFGTRILVDEITWRAASTSSPPAASTGLPQAASSVGQLSELPSAGLPSGWHFIARPLGKVLVVGRSEPVAVWNVLGAGGQVLRGADTCLPAGQVRPAPGDAADRGQIAGAPAAPSGAEPRWLADEFAKALGLYQSRRFAEAAEAFDAILRRLPDDKPSAIFLGFCQRCAAAPPDEAWTAVVQLSEK